MLAIVVMVTAGQREGDLTSVKWAQLQAEREKTTASLHSDQADMATIKPLLGPFSVIIAEDKTERERVSSLCKKLQKLFLYLTHT